MPTRSECSITYDPLHGYIPFTSGVGLSESESSEREIIDHPWLQRLRQIHQLQTAWWVFPSAEHTRFQHVIGAMHLASRFVDQVYDGLCDACPEEDVPSKGYVDCLMRMAGLLHDVGHGPFGHFFDEYFLKEHGETHESIGAFIIENELADSIRALRRSPSLDLAAGEELDPHQIAVLIQRPKESLGDAKLPRWISLLRSLLSGIYTIDNMDFVLRDAYMSGYSQRSYDPDRLIIYSSFTEQGLTIDDRGLDALLRFMTARSQLFNTIYFHRTVRAIDLTLADLFQEGKSRIFPGNPLDHLGDYQKFTEWSILIDAARWADDDDPHSRRLGMGWQAILRRQIPWQMVCERKIVFRETDSEQSSIFSDSEFVRSRIVQELNGRIDADALRVDIARHLYRPHTFGPTRNQNFLFDSVRRVVRPLTDSQLFRQLPVSQRICRIYSRGGVEPTEIATAMDRIIGMHAPDDVTNM